MGCSGFRGRRWMALAALIIAMISATASLAVAQTVPAASIHWERDAAAAFAQAKATHRNLVIDMYADWCVECHHLDHTTYLDPQVVVWSRRAVFLKQNSEKEGVPLVQRFQVDAYPTILFLDEEGNLVGRINGYLPGPRFLQALERFGREAGELDRSLNGTATQPGDAQLQLRAAAIEISRQQYPAAERHLQLLKASLPESSPLYPRFLLAKGVLLFRTGRSGQAVAACDGVLAHQPAPVDALFARYYRILSLVRLGQRDQAKAGIEDFIARYPSDPHRQQLADLLQQLHNPFED